MRPVLPPCSTEALKIRYAALGGVLSGDGSLNGLIDTTPNRLAPEFSARFVDPSTFVSRGSLTIPLPRQPETVTTAVRRTLPGQQA
jgi:hypothetical protein